MNKVSFFAFVRENIFFDRLKIFLLPLNVIFAASKKNHDGKGRKKE
jgi:hypothetical protein